MQVPNHPSLHRRGSILYFRRAVPADVRAAFGGRLEVVVSLTQIAARLKGTSSEYCPDHILGDALAVRDWRASFKAWKEKLPREHRWMAEPEVFDLITCSRQLQSGAKWLERRGFFELAGEEHEEAEALLGTPQGLAWQHGHVRIRKALKALVGRAPKVAVRVAKSGQTYDHFVRFADWMEKPS